MVSTPSKQAVKLFHEGTLALSEVESNGIRIDMEYLSRCLVDVEKDIERLETKLRSGKVWNAWRKRYGTKAQLGSRQQLGVMLFDVMGLESNNRTKSGRYSTDEKALEEVDSKFVRAYLKAEKLKKLHGTYLKGLKREVTPDGYLHPSFNLNLVKTYRSSSSNPNFQNIPIRNDDVAKIIRKAFIPRKNHVLVEIDYGAVEVRVAACYHKDPTMLKYIRTGYDMHFDMAKDCFRLGDDEVSKQARHAAKNGFVFPAFYGSYWASIAPNLWGMITRNDIKTKDGLCLYEHLSQQGIESLGSVSQNEAEPGSFYDHIKKVEHDFWRRRFKVYQAWKDDWWKQFCDRGYYKTKTGFVVQGVLARTEVINYCVQGSAFHCLLWSLININRWFRQSKLRALIVGQIHDSLIMDVHKDDLDEVLRGCKKIMCDDLTEAWKWIITPLEVEADVATTNWYEKKEYPIG